MKEIEDFLRDNKPSVKADPTFILETRRRLEQVEGIKSEVDRQHRRGRMALIIALVAGQAVGVLASVLAFLYPIDASSIGEGLWQSIRLFLQEYRQYIVYPVAAMAITLSIVLGKRSSGVA